MIDPLPNAFSICPTAASSARVRPADSAAVAFAAAAAAAVCFVLAAGPVAVVFFVSRFFISRFFISRFFISTFFVSIGVFISELLPSDLSDFPSAGFAVDVVVAAVAVAGVVVTVLA